MAREQGSAFFDACALIYTGAHLKRCYAARHNNRDMQAMLAWIPDWWQTHWRAQQIWIEQHDAPAIKPKPYCLGCGNELVVFKHRDARYCCNDCYRDAAYRRNKRNPEWVEKSRARVREWYRKHRARLREQRPPKRCIVCRKYFRPYNDWRKICSLECKRLRKRMLEATLQRRQYHRERGREYREKRKRVLQALREIGIVRDFEFVEQS